MHTSLSQSTLVSKIVLISFRESQDRLNSLSTLSSRDFCRGTFLFFNGVFFVCFCVEKRLKAVDDQFLCA